MHWNLSEDGLTVVCAVHQTSFGKAETCPACLTDPPPPIEAEDDKLQPPPKGCASTECHEAAFVRLARFTQARAKAVLANGKSDRTIGSAAKLIELSIKARRAATELAQAREDREHTRRLEKIAAKLTNTGKA